MPLINLKTDLKSLKYGRDRVGGGSSNQPFVQTPIPESLSLIGITGGYDSLARGGTLIGGAIVTDERRIGKLINTANTFQGAAFKTKLNTLSKLNVRTQADTGDQNQGTYLTRRTLGQIAAQPLGQHINLFQGNLSYSDVVKVPTSTTAAFGNRLYALYKSKISENVEETTKMALSAQGFDILKGNNQQLLSYKGGPGAAQDGGSTIINLTNPTVKNKPLEDTYADYLMSALQLASQTAYKGGPITNLTDFRTKVTNAKFGSSNYGLNASLPPRNKYQGDPGNRSLSTNPTGSDPHNSYWGNRENGTNTANWYPLVKSTDRPDTGDFIPFTIAVISNNPLEENRTWITFPSMIENISDSFQGEWESFRAMGRGEKFHTYQGFNREIGFSFNVHAQSKAELFKQYQKLNYLASVLAPNYAAGIMQGNFVELTIGAYITDVPGIITQLSYDISQESTWDIFAGLPHMIKVTMNFTPIHKFIPKLDTSYINYLDGGNTDEDGNILPAIGFVDSPFLSLSSQV